MSCENVRSPVFILFIFISNGQDALIFSATPQLPIAFQTQNRCGLHN